MRSAHASRRRLRVRALRLLAAASAAATLVIAASVVTAPPTATGVALTSALSLVDGMTMIKHADGTIEIGQDGVLVAAGDIVFTIEASHAMLTFPDGAIVSLDPETELAIDALESTPTGGMVVVLDQTAGRSWHAIGHKLSEDSRYEVRSGDSVASVRGTSFEWQVSPEGAKTTVVEGVVSAKGVTGQPQFVGEGQRSSVPTKGAAQAPEPAPAPALAVEVVIAPKDGGSLKGAVVADPLGRPVGVTAEGRTIASVPGSKVEVQSDGSVRVTMPVESLGAITTRARQDQAAGALQIDTQIKAGGQLLGKITEQRQAKSGEVKGGVFISQSGALPLPDAVANAALAAKMPVAAPTEAIGAPQGRPVPAPDAAAPAQGAPQNGGGFRFKPGEAPPDGFVFPAGFGDYSGKAAPRGFVFPSESQLRPTNRISLPGEAGAPGAGPANGPARGPAAPDAGQGPRQGIPADPAFGPAAPDSFRGRAPFAADGQRPPDAGRGLPSGPADQTNGRAPNANDPFRAFFRGSDNPNGGALLGPFGGPPNANDVVAGGGQGPRGIPNFGDQSAPRGLPFGGDVPGARGGTPGGPSQGTAGMPDGFVPFDRTLIIVPEGSPSGGPVDPRRRDFGAPGGPFSPDRGSSLPGGAPGADPFGAQGSGTGGRGPSGPGSFPVEGGPRPPGFDPSGSRFGGFDPSRGQPFDPTRGGPPQGPGGPGGSAPADGAKPGAAGPAQPQDARAPAGPPRGAPDPGRAGAPGGVPGPEVGAPPKSDQSRPAGAPAAPDGRQPQGAPVDGSRQTAPGDPSRPAPPDSRGPAAPDPRQGGADPGRGAPDPGRAGPDPRAPGGDGAGGPPTGRP